MTARLSEWLSTITMGVRLLLVFNILITIFTEVFGADKGSFILCLGPVLYNKEVYRIMTAAFLHADFIHLLMNMVALVSVGPVIESALGTLAFIGLCLSFALLSGFLYCMYFLTWFMWLSPVGDTSSLWACCLGFSAVLFGLIVLSTSINRSDKMNLFGIISVPSFLYPWVLLVFIQVLVKNVSLVGHLSGLLVGLLYIRGWTNFFTMKRSWIVAFEKYSVFDNLSSYKKCPSEPHFKNSWDGFITHTYRRVHEYFCSRNQYSIVADEEEKAFFPVETTIDVNRLKPPIENKN